jgi:hypothetical protein
MRSRLVVFPRLPSLRRTGRFTFRGGNEFGLTEQAAGGPFGEFDFGFDFGAEPAAVGHFVGGDAPELAKGVAFL